MDITIRTATPEDAELLTEARVRQLMDEGRLTDGQRRTVDFSNTVIIIG